MSATLPILNPAVDTAHSPKPGILDVPTEELRAWLAERRQPPMRVNQVRRQILAGRTESFDAMTDLPKDLRPELAASFAVFQETPLERRTAS